MKRRFVVLVLGLMSAGVAQEKKATLSVTNISSISRRQEPVVVPWKLVQLALPGHAEQSVLVADEQGRFMMTQIDDLDADGVPDELVFVTDMKPQQVREFLLMPGPTPTNLPAPPVRTDAGNWKRSDKGPESIDDDNGAGLLRAQSTYRFDGIGWESEVTGYRVYLDERNAVDIQGKRIPGLYWNYIGASSVDYQADAVWGMDVLHVGPALGVGGFAFWSSDSVVKPLVLDRRRARVIARGPVRAVVRIDYEGWQVGNDRLNVVSHFTIYAGERMTAHRVTLLNGGVRTIATGIVKHQAGKIRWDPSMGMLVSEGAQSRSGEDLTMAIHVDPEVVDRVTADEWSDLLLLKLQAGEPVEYLISNWWDGEPEGVSAWTLNGTTESAKNRLKSPLQIVLK